MARQKYRTVPAGRRAASRWVVGCHPIEDHICEPCELGEPWNYQGLMVVETEPEWRDTGLLDPHGDAIMVQNREPIGFLSEILS